MKYRVALLAALIASLAGAINSSIDPSPRPLLLEAADGEQRMRFPRPGITVNQLPSFVIKVDSRNGGARNLLMLSEEMRPGAVIPWHRHLHEDEIVYTENGTINARVGNRTATLGAHATVYIPQNTWVTIKNSGSVPVRLIAIFDRNNFDGFLRCTSRAPDETSRFLSKTQLAACQKRGDVQYR